MIRESSAPNDWGIFYWLHAGTTLVGAELSLQLLSYKTRDMRWPPRPLKNALVRTG